MVTFALTIYCIPSLSAENLTLNTTYPSPIGSYGGFTVIGSLNACAPPRRCAIGTNVLGADGILTVSGRTAGGNGTSIIINDIDNSQSSNIIFNQEYSTEDNGWGDGLRIRVCGSASTDPLCTSGQLFFPLGYFSTRSLTETNPTIKMLTGRGIAIGTTTTPFVGLLVNGTAWLRGGESPTGLYVNSSGNVGIGTTLPTSALQVNGQIQANPGSLSAPGYSFWGRFPYTTNSRNGVYSDNDNNLVFVTNATERMRIDPNGNVGIGVSAPTQRLEVLGTARANDWVTVSSRKFKKDISPLSPADYQLTLQEIEKMDLSYFRYINQQDEHRYLGVIAEDAPNQIVSEDRDSLNTTEFIAFTLAGIKALNRQVNNLKTKLEQKDKENKNLRKRIEKLAAKLNNKFN